MNTAEHIRLDEARERKTDWKKWGPYLSERQWGTVREDYSYTVAVGAGQSEVIRVRLSRTSSKQEGSFGKAFDDVFAARIREADDFYASVTPPSVSADAANVMRRALAGMLWSKQFFFFDGDNWLDEHHSNPLHHGYRHMRNSEWSRCLRRPRPRAGAENG